MSDGSRAVPPPGEQPPSTGSKVEHVVLLMMENRSFDSLLGWLYEKTSPAHNIGPVSGDRKYEGLQGLNLKDYENQDSTGTIKVSPIRGAQALNVPNVAPGERFEEVATQLYGKEAPQAGDVPTMRGYVRDYVNVLRHQKFPEDQVKRFANQVMQSYTPDQVPVLSGLAEHYAVCDLWFSSVPSQTNTNRAFTLCGTSMGLVNNGFLEEDPRAKQIEEKVGYPLGDDRFHARTIFNTLFEGGVSWKIYRQSGMLQSNVLKAADAIKQVLGGIPKLETLLSYLHDTSSQEVVSDYTHRLFPEIGKIQGADRNFAMMDEFFVAAREGRLPQFSYLTPEWTIGERGTGSASSLRSVLFHQGDDYHPPGNVYAGENLARKVYESLIANRSAWEKTLLILTFDEPVGAFDHVPPPGATPPWGDGEPAFAREKSFRFDRFGGRVPAILVSPLIERGTVFRSSGTPYDHTSIISSVLAWRGMKQRIPEFGERARRAPDFWNVVTRSEPRRDERDIRFLKLARQRGQPVHFYDRFMLRGPNGQYISRFREGKVAPFSIFGDDPSMTEYFPTLSYVQGLDTGRISVLHFQNATNRPDPGPLGTNQLVVKLIAGDDGLGSYCVLGAWNDSHNCYYFNDYLEGPNDSKQTWIISNVKPGPVCFGDRVYIQNQHWQGQRLASDGEYLTTRRDDGAWWTIEPLSDELPGADAIRLDGVGTYYLKHVKSGRYVTTVHKGAQWYPTLGETGNRIKLKLRMPSGMGYRGDAPVLGDGTSVEIASTEVLVHGSRPCNVLMAWTNPYLYYYYDDYSREYQKWTVSAVAGSGLIKAGGTQVRLINNGYGQSIVPKDSYLTTASDDGPDSVWLIEKA